MELVRRLEVVAVDPRLEVAHKELREVEGVRLVRVQMTRSSAAGLEAAHSGSLPFWASVVYRGHFEMSAVLWLYYLDAG